MIFQHKKKHKDDLKLSGVGSRLYIPSFHCHD